MIKRTIIIITFFVSWASSVYACIPASGDITKLTFNCTGDCGSMPSQMTFSITEKENVGGYCEYDSDTGGFDLQYGAPHRANSWNMVIDATAYGIYDANGDVQDNDIFVISSLSWSAYGYPVSTGQYTFSYSSESPDPFIQDILIKATGTYANITGMDLEKTGLWISGFFATFSGITLGVFNEVKAPAVALITIGLIVMIGFIGFKIRHAI